MYTYESFVTNGSFTLLRPVFITLFVIAILLVLLIVIPITKKFLNGLAVISLSLVTVILSIQLTFFDAIIVDEIGLGGDVTSFIMSIIIIILGLVNPFLYFRKNPNNKRDRNEKKRTSDL